MRHSFLPVLVSLLLAVLVVPVASQGEATEPVSTPSRNSTRFSYRKLTWDDFQINDVAPGMSAQTNTFTSYSYKARAVGRDTTFEASVTEITFDGGFDRARSWRRSRIPRTNTLLLEHEQGHLDINELKLRQLRRLRMDQLPRGYGATAEEAFKDLRERLDAMYTAEVEDMRKTQDRYDRETLHGTRTQIQKQWTARLNRALQQLPPVS